MKKGFTLVELSIVLVILGLLVGGVLAGQSLIHASEIRSVVTEIQKFDVAMAAFREKYAAVPGDMSNATQYWGSAGGNGSNNACFNSTGTPPQTCNGNGDGTIHDTTASAIPIYEDIRSWQHLSNAELIDGKYTGRWSPTWSFLPGVNAPKSRYGNVVYYMKGYATTKAATTTQFGGEYRNTAFMMGPNSERNIMTPEDAWSIDKKMDDGHPGRGLLLGTKGDATYPCTSNAGVLADNPNATYNLSDSRNLCSIARLQL